MNIIHKPIIYPHFALLVANAPLDNDKDLPLLQLLFVNLQIQDPELN